MREVAVITDKLTPEQYSMMSDMENISWILYAIFLIHKSPLCERTHVMDSADFINRKEPTDEEFDRAIKSLDYAELINVKNGNYNLSNIGMSIAAKSVDIYGDHSENWRLLEFRVQNYFTEVVFDM